MQVRAPHHHLSAVIATSLASAAAITAAAFLLAGPGAPRRRTLAGDRVKHVKRAAAAHADQVARRLRQRAQGAAASARGPDANVDDVVLEQRARAALGHVCSHPHAIKTTVHNGELRLKGPVLAGERRAVVKHLSRVPGIVRVVDDVEEPEEPGAVPALQGGGRAGQREAAPRETWSPAARAVVGTVGAGLVVLACADRRAVSLAGGGVGALLLLSALSNRSPRSFNGSFEVHKSLHIRAPLDDVFAIFRSVEQFPRFMTHVREVRKLDEDHYLWRVDGPFGPISSTCEITTWLPTEGIAWKSIDDGPTAIDGRLRFHEENGGTRLEVQLSYRPPIGGVGYRLAKVLRRDPKRFLDDDLLRLKSLIENGKTTGRGEQVSLAELRDERAPATNGIAILG